MKIEATGTIAGADGPVTIIWENGKLSGDPALVLMLKMFHRHLRRQSFSPCPEVGQGPCTLKNPLRVAGLILHRLFDTGRLLSFETSEPLYPEGGP
jgi:hypothetical protein